MFFILLIDLGPIESNNSVDYPDYAKKYQDELR